VTGGRIQPWRPARREEGFVLFLAIFVLLIVTVAGIATMLATSMDLTLSGNDTKVSKIFYAADSGIEYCAAQLRSDVNYAGGQMPVGVSSNYAGSTSADIQVTITRPIVIGQQVHPGDSLLAQGTTYGTPQIVESLFSVFSFASATSIQASKTIRADISLYPQVLSIVPQ
jgi:Tfp pilus assembly protein PilX